jgi:hypothetical protein
MANGVSKHVPECGAHTLVTSIDVHELGNLVTIIIAEAQLLQMELDPQAPGHASAAAIERAARRLQEALGVISSNGVAQNGETPVPQDGKPESELLR